MAKNKAVRITLWAVGGVVVLAAIALVVVWLRLDSYAKDTVETSATNSFGLPAETDRVHVSVFSGDIGVNKFRVANVEGYSPDRMMAIDDIAVGVELGSLWEETLRVPQIEMENMRLFIQRKGLTSNVSQMLAKMRQRADEAPAEPGRKLMIDRVVIRNIVATVDLGTGGTGGTGKPVEVTIPELVLEEVTRENANSVAMEEVIRRIFPAIIAAVVEQGEGILPADLIGSIQADLDKTIAAMGEEAQRVIGQAAGDLLGGVLKDAPGAGENGVDENLEGVGEKLKGVLGGDKKRE